ncbi:hypothetical protein EV360DRAFT_91209 [Lentinula raphanica]|nr:hypothetical protein EV360DRAFT_91209 [Lentinula raphanica]
MVPDWSQQLWFFWPCCPSPLPFLNLPPVFGFCGFLSRIEFSPPLLGMLLLLPPFSSPPPPPPRIGIDFLLSIIALLGTQPHPPPPLVDDKDNKSFLPTNGGGHGDRTDIRVGSGHRKGWGNFG